MDILLFPLSLPNLVLELASILHSCNIRKSIQELYIRYMYKLYYTYLCKKYREKFQINATTSITGVRSIYEDSCNSEDTDTMLTVSNILQLAIMCTIQWYVKSGM